MKRKIVFRENISTNGREMKTSETEVNIRDIDHLNAQMKFRSSTFKPKKGKGSFTRKTKHHSYDEY